MKPRKKDKNGSVEILIVEDSPTQAEQLRNLLEEAGYKVRAAANGQEALAAARKHKPTLIISDIVMPEMDGYAFCKEIKSKKKLEDIPVVLLTQLSSPEDVIKGLQCGADNFIRKPYDPKYLLSRVEYILTNRKLRSTEKVHMGLEIYLSGQRHFITSERQQILDLLVSTYEEAVCLNEELKVKQKDLARSYQSLNGLYFIAEGLNKCTNVQEVSEKALERSMQLPGVRAGWIVLREGEVGFRVQAVHNLPPVLERPGAMEGDCFCRQQLLSGELDHAANIMECERLQTAEGERYGLRYHASIPLRADSRTLGIMNLAATDEELFSKEDLKLLYGVGNQIAVALERAQLYENLEKKVQERTAALRSEVVERKRAQEEVQLNLERIRALHEIDLAITSILDLRTILNVLLNKIASFVPHIAASTVRLVNKKTGELEPAACWNLDEEEWRAATAGVSAGGIARMVPGNNAPVMVLDAQTDPRSLAPEFLRKYGLVSSLRVPLVAKNEVLGALTFFTKEEHEFSNEEIQFLSTLAGQAAIAINNAQLYEKIDHSRKELELTNQYLDKSLKLLSGLYTALTPLTTSESVREMMDGIIERLMEATGADAALIRLKDKEKGGFYWASQRGFPESYLKATASPPPGSALEQVFNSGEPVIASDIASDSRLKGKNQLQVGLRSCAMLPLKVQQEVRGIVHLASRKPGYFDEEQGDHLMAIARQMGIALENKDHFDNLRSSRDELEKSNRVKDEFLSVMSHELRTPLNVVVGYTGMIMDGLLGEVNDKQKEAMEKVINRTNDQLAMVNNILYATIIETEKIKVESHPVVLGDFFKQLSSTYETPLNKQLLFNWDCPSPLAVFHTDSAKLKQILQNLIDNALKFTGKGSVTVSARITEGTKQKAESSKQTAGKLPTADGLLPTGEGRWVELKVADTGVGIPPDALPLIFDKFKQVDSSETRLFGGVGMGLYIVRKFAELLGGTVEVESEAGKGSTFTVTLPCGQ